MKNEDIKVACEHLFTVIKMSEDKLSEIRKICKHEKTYEGNYSWRPGAIQLADICEYCGELVQYK